MSFRPTFTRNSVRQEGQPSSKRSETEESRKLQFESNVNDFIPLLSVRPFVDFTPSEYKIYVSGLFRQRVKKKTQAKKKRLRDLKVSAKLTKKGKLSITTRRSPKYVTEDEMREIARQTGRGQNEIFITITEKDFIVCEHERAEEIQIDLTAMPF